MIEQQTRPAAAPWLLAAASALLGAAILFDAYPGINAVIWVAFTVLGALYCQRSSDLTRARPAMMLALVAVLAAGADTRTTDQGANFGIFCLTTFLLGAFLTTIRAQDADEVTFFTLLRSPFVAVATVAVSAFNAFTSAFRSSSESSSKTMLRRLLLVAPVVVVLIVLLGGADPVIHSGIQTVADWLPVTISARAVFFVFLFLVTIGAFSRLPEFKLSLPFQGGQLRGGPTAGDGTVLVASTLATLVLFLLLQLFYLFVRVPSEIGNGVTYAEYARRGFGELCVVVTIVAAVILLAEKLRGSSDVPRSPTLRNLELATVLAAALVLVSALRRVVLYEQAYGYTVARVQATAYIVFMAGFLILLVAELVRGGITSALARRSAALGFVVLLAILYWNDQAWIMNRNIDRIHTTGKFDASYAASLSPDALPTIAARRNEIPAADWITVGDRMACKRVRGPVAWYEWNTARSAARSVVEDLHLPAASKCPARTD